jgi:hypothetical protein
LYEPLNPFNLGKIAFEAVPPFMAIYHPCFFAQFTFKPLFFPAVNADISAFSKTKTPALRIWTGLISDGNNIRHKNAFKKTASFARVSWP